MFTLGLCQVSPVYGPPSQPWSDHWHQCSQPVVCQSCVTVCQCYCWLTSMTWARLRLVASPALVRADHEPPMLCVSSVGIQPAWCGGWRHVSYYALWSNYWSELSKVKLCKSTYRHPPLWLSQTPCRGKGSSGCPPSRLSPGPRYETSPEENVQIIMNSIKFCVDWHLHTYNGYSFF